MNKYQEALDCIKRFYAENEHYDEENIRLLQELIDQQSNPTFDECIKMWEEDGWHYSTSKEYGNHIFYKDGTYIKIFKREGIYNNSYIKESYYADCEGPLIAKPILPKEHNLIHKTLKALEEKNDN